MSEMKVNTSAYHCGIPGCKGDSRYDPGKKLRFHAIPKEADTRERWLKAVKEGLGEPLSEHKINSKNTKICSRHFYINDYAKTLNGHVRLRKDAVPHFPPNQMNWAKNKGRRKRNYLGKESSSEDENDLGITCIVPNESFEDEPQTSKTHYQPPPGRSDHGYCLQPSEDPNASGSGRNSPPIVIESDRITMKEVFEAALRRNNQLEKQVELLKGIVFSVERFTNDPELIDFYTGFKDYATFKAVFKALEPTAERMLRWSQVQRPNIKSNKQDMCFKNEKILLIDQFFLFLFRVRRGWTSKDIANRFKVSTSTVSRMIITWTNYMYFILGSVPLWISKSSNEKNMPDVFKKTTYTNTRVIISTHYLKVQKPSSKETNTEMYSLDKEHTMFKGLIGVSPCGATVFVSSLYTGNISDRELTSRSGILDLLEPDDEIMVEKELPISDLLSIRRIKLNRLPLSQNYGEPYSSNETEEPPELTRIKAHVKKITHRIKKYHIFDNELNLSLAGTINQLWAVCCILTNFHGLDSSS